MILLSLRSIITELDRRFMMRLFGNPLGGIELITRCFRRFLNRFLSHSFKPNSNFNEALMLGYARLGTPFEVSFSEYLHQLLESAIKTKTDTIEVKHGDEVVSSSIRIDSEHEWYAQFDSKIRSTEVADFLRNALNGEFLISQFVMWRNYSLPVDAMNYDFPDYYSTRWHVDGSGSNVAKVFLFLHDTTINHGPTYIASKQQTRKILRKGYKIRRESSKSLNEIENIENDPQNIMTGKKGEAFYFDPDLCLHRAGVPASYATTG